jgi:hypothetical protein
LYKNTPQAAEALAEMDKALPPAASEQAEAAPAIREQSGETQ